MVKCRSTGFHEVLCEVVAELRFGTRSKQDGSGETSETCGGWLEFYILLSFFICFHCMIATALQMHDSSIS